MIGVHKKFNPILGAAVLQAGSISAPWQGLGRGLGDSSTRPSATPAITMAFLFMAFALVGLTNAMSHGVGTPFRHSSSIATPATVVVFAMAILACVAILLKAFRRLSYMMARVRKPRSPGSISRDKSIDQTADGPNNSRDKLIDLFQIGFHTALKRGGEAEVSATLKRYVRYHPSKQDLIDEAMRRFRGFQRKHTPKS